MKIGEEVRIIEMLIACCKSDRLHMTGTDQPRAGRDRTHYNDVLDQMLTSLTRAREWSQGP